MNFSKLIILAAMIALISTPLFFASSDAEAATTGKRSKSSKSKTRTKAKTRTNSKAKAKSKSKKTHRLTKKTRRNSSSSSRAPARNTKRTSTPARRKTVTRTTRNRSNGRTTTTTTTRRTTRAQHGSTARRRTVVRHNTGHHVSSNRSRRVVHHHTTSCSHHSHRQVTYRAPRRTVVHHHRAPSRTVVHHETRTEAPSVRSNSSSVEFYVNGGLGLNSLNISDVSESSLNGTNYRVAIGGKGDLFGVELGVDGGSFAFDDGTTLSMVGANVDVKVQPKFGMLEPYLFVGLGGYQLRDNVFDEDAGSGALRAGAGADVRINNVGIGAKYTWAAYDFQNDQSYVNVGASTQTLSGNLSFYF